MTFTNMHFAYPWVFALFPLLLLLPYIRRKKLLQAVPVPTTQILTSRLGGKSRLRRILQPLLAISLLAMLVTASARPQKVTSLTLGEENRRNLILVLDTSRSMEAPDFLSSKGVVRRIDGVKFVTGDFIQQREGDRIGLVLFASQAFLQAPLTIDHQFLASLVDEIQLGVAGDGTAIGDGLGVALKQIEELPADSRAIILLTDGVSNSGRVEPIKAAKIAHDLGVKIYTIGIGSSDGGYIRLNRGMFGSQRMKVEFDEKTLQEIAATTGGKYYYASDMSSLDLVYREIDALERTKRTELQFIQTEELAFPFLFAALALFCLHYIFSQTIFRVVP